MPLEPFKRIPQHDHSDRDSGGRIAPSTVVAAIGGDSGGNSSVPVDAYTTSQSDDLFLTRRGGEGHVVAPTSSSGAALTLDLSTGNAFDVTLTANCTITITNPPASGVLGQFLVILRQGGTGSYTVTWPGSVDWQDTDGTTGGAAPTLWTAVGAQDAILLSTLDGGTTWGGTHLSAAAATSFATPAIVLGTAAAAGAASTAVRTDATIIAFDATVPTTQAFGDSAATGSAAFAARRDHVHGMPATPVTEAAILAVVALHAHVTGETHLSDGSTTAYTLDEAFEPGSVEAFNTTTLAYLTVTEAQPDQATVSAAGTTGDKITFSYAATVA